MTNNDPKGYYQTLNVLHDSSSDEINPLLRIYPYNG